MVGGAVYVNDAFILIAIHPFALPHLDAHLSRPLPLAPLPLRFLLLEVRLDLLPEPVGEGQVFLKKYPEKPLLQIWIDLREYPCPLHQVIISFQEIMYICT
jgi:hypothetical protein